MTSKQTRVLRKCAGEDEASDLLYWLNERRRTADHARIERLLKNLAILRRWFGEGTNKADELPWDAGVSWDVGLVALSDSRSALASVRRELRRHRFWPALANVVSPSSRTKGSKLDFWWSPVKRSGANMSAAVLTIQLLGTSGLLHRIQQCKKCSRWFFARTIVQKLCSEKCRKQLYKSSPQFKEHRRKYMRQYRAHTEAKRFRKQKTGGRKLGSQKTR